MHLGRHYPFLFEFWLVEAFFWPGYVPRKLHVSCAPGYGSDWDRLSPGIVTTGYFTDDPITGDLVYTYFFAAAVRTLQVRFHKVADDPKRYSIVVRFLGPLQPTIVANGEFGSPQYSFPAEWGFFFVSTFPPWSLGGLPPLQIRAATWSEV